ncbi:hypothetical protein ACHZIB_004103 [Yersinia enterocolitica]|nr:hypothetical protein [Yersinia enterocolitica]MDA5533272.1 hypothetical protein [Yersinia enterocolitica]CQJ24190.1 Uncharacterised protein [Yersinia enterocolitica]CQQ90920.1 Uncharacterised protein [Yersinia enterocolitica]CQR10814.1 Uncharacterised protein [Yersinia enterocolitica]
MFDQETKDYAREQENISKNLEYRVTELNDSRSDHRNETMRD